MVVRDGLVAVTESGGSAVPSSAVPVVTSKSMARLEDVEKQQIIAILEQVRWHRGRAAELLGISPKTLYRKLRSYGITNRALASGASREREDTEAAHLLLLRRVPATVRESRTWTSQGSSA